MSVLQIEHLTKDYGSGRGVFDVSLSIETPAKRCSFIFANAVSEEVY